MLNPFPIQFLAILAYTILRLTIGILFIYFGALHVTKRHDLKYALSLPWFPFGSVGVWLLSGVEFLVGVMFIFGFYTQIAAILSMILSLKLIVFNKRFASPYIPSRLFYILLLGASLSLFITGAGAFAFDLPI